MTTFMQEEIDLDGVPRKTDVPVTTTMTRCPQLPLTPPPPSAINHMKVKNYHFQPP